MQMVGEGINVGDGVGAGVGTAGATAGVFGRAVFPVGANVGEAWPAPTMLAGRRIGSAVPSLHNASKLPNAKMLNRSRKPMNTPHWERVQVFTAAYSGPAGAAFSSYTLAQFRDLLY